jgi:hypothetical protein
MATILQGLGLEDPDTGEETMSHTPDWIHGGGESDSKPDEARGISMLAVIGWIAAIVVTANLLFVALRFMG